MKTAFLNSTIDIEVYVKQPPGFIDSEHPDWVWKLHRVMYGLKQAPLLWNDHINAALVSLGFIRHPGENGLYFHHSRDGLVLLGLYVDDILVATPSSDTLAYVKRKLFQAYTMKDLGPVSKFLGLNIHQNPNGSVYLTLADYISSAAATADIPLCQAPPTPLSPTTNYLATDSPPVSNITEYQSIVGQLIFVANAGRPNIALAVSYLARFLKAPREIYLTGAKRTLSYLYASRFHGLSYRKEPALRLTLYSDASHGSANDLPYSTGGMSCTSLVVL